jgi:hypothetical protein
MLDIKIENVEELVEKLNAVVEHVETMGRSTMPEELTAWQKEDMRRRYANTTTPDDKTAFTEIWPRSRLSGQRQVTHRASSRQLRTAVSRPGGAGRPRSDRQILRPELFEKLCARMRALLAKTMEWPSGKQS